MHRVNVGPFRLQISRTQPNRVSGSRGQGAVPPVAPIRPGLY